MGVTHTVAAQRIIQHSVAVCIDEDGPTRQSLIPSFLHAVTIVILKLLTADRDLLEVAEVHAWHVDTTGCYDIRRIRRGLYPAALENLAYPLRTGPHTR